MRHRTVLDVTANLGHLEPVQTAQRRGGTDDRALDGVVDALGRGADYLGDAVRVARHLSLLVAAEPRFSRVPAADATNPAGQLWTAGFG
jgi:hypothetical protein